MFAFLIGLFGFGGLAAGGLAGGSDSSKPDSNPTGDRINVTDEAAVDEDIPVVQDEVVVSGVETDKEYDPTQEDIAGEIAVEEYEDEEYENDFVEVVEIEDETKVSEETPSAADEAGLTDIEGGEDITVLSGRVTNLAVEGDDIAEIRVTDMPSDGNLTVNADNSLSFVLSDTDFTGSTQIGYEVTFTDGSVQSFTSDIEVIPGPQEGGWGLGDNYELETDSDGDLVLEHGDNHRDIYVSNSNEALTVADIAALEGLADEDITTRWLLDHPEYGGSEIMALSEEVGMEVWYASTNGDKDPTSNWLLFERGYDYTETGRLIGKDSDGESELHPLVITSWGEGDKPVIHETLNIYQENSANVVVTDVAFDAKVQVLDGTNILLDNLSVTGHEVNIHNVDGFTLRESDISDAVHENSLNSEEFWGPSQNRISGLFVTDSQGVLIEDNLFDHNGWEDDYLEDTSTDGGQPPSFYSHNVYIQDSNSDVTFTDNISIEAASIGVLIRSGGFIEGNVLVDNNVGLVVLGGDYKDRGPVGEYALVTDNVTTSGAHKTVDKAEGGLTQGNVDQSELSTWLDNIVAHLADPNNLEEELEYKVTSHNAYNVEDEQYFDNTIIYNWKGSQAYENEAAGAGIRNPDTNTEDLDTDVLNQTTIQIFAANLLGKPDATIDDLSDYLRTQYAGQLEGDVDAETIIDFFHTGFSISTEVDDDATLNTFAPNALGEGVRWDNKLNWDQDYVPTDSQDIDLNGNWVYYSDTVRVDDLNLGDSGELHVTGGYLGVLGDLSAGDGGALVTLTGAGQFWTNGYSDDDVLEIDAIGGRFSNVGDVTGEVNASFSGNAQAILATDGGQFDLGEESTLTVTGGDAKVGFDGENGGIAALRLDQDSILSFGSADGELGSIGEFRSGAYGDETNVNSGVHLGDSTISLDLSGIDGAYSTTLIEADLLIGSFDVIEVTGLGDDRNATLTIDYETDTVTFDITTDGSGELDFGFSGEAESLETLDAQAIWEVLTAGQGTYSDDLPEEEENGDLPFLDAA